MIADIDDDGWPEIGVGGHEYYTAFETDGSIKRSVPIVDMSSRSASSSAFDFNEDGSIPQFEANSWDFLNHYRTQSPAAVCKSDFDKDGDVDAIDLLTFMGSGTGITLAEFATEFGRTD